MRGSYGYTDATGTYREVRYIADHNGFRADVKTNEHGTMNMYPANVEIASDYGKRIIPIRKPAIKTKPLGYAEELDFIKKPVVKPKTLVYAAELNKPSNPKHAAAYSDVRFFHFGNHYHEEKHGSGYEDDDEDNGSNHNSEEEKTNANDADEEDGSYEQEENDERESDAEERTLFHRFGQHGGHE